MDARNMTLLDTNVLVDFQDTDSPFHAWAANVIKDAVSTEGAAVNALTVAELVSGGMERKALDQSLNDAGIEIHDLPTEAAYPCGKAYRRYKMQRKISGGGIGPSTPLPDFFIGAHAEAMGWKLATRDSQRFKTYFPKVALVEP